MQEVLFHTAVIFWGKKNTTFDCHHNRGDWLKHHAEQNNSSKENQLTEKHLFPSVSVSKLKMHLWSKKYWLPCRNELNRTH